MCKHCDFLHKTFLNHPSSTVREYWLFTEVFVYLHDGKDYCKNSNPINKALVNDDYTDDELHAFS